MVEKTFFGRVRQILVREIFQKSVCDNTKLWRGFDPRFWKSIPLRVQILPVRLLGYVA